MARTFVRANSDYCEVASSPLTGTLGTYTLAAWYKPSSISGGTVVSLGDTNSVDYAALGMGADGKVFLEINAAITTADAFSTGTLTSGSWSHVAGVVSSSANHVAYLNGTAGTADTTDVAPGGPDTVTVGGLVIGGSRVSYAGGDIAEVAIWDTNLSGAQVSSLASGALPSTIPTGLVGYWKITGTNSPELDSTAGARDLTVSGTTAGTDDPPGVGGGGGGAAVADTFIRVSNAWIAVDRQTRVSGGWVS